MKLIIDIPEKTNAHIRSDYGHGVVGLRYDDEGILCHAVYHGTPYEPQPHVDCRDRLKEVFREHSSISGDMFHLYQIEQIIDGEPWL